MPAGLLAGLPVWQKAGRLTRVSVRKYRIGLIYIIRGIWYSLLIVDRR
jgi:hypothetical protein